MGRKRLLTILTAVVVAVGVPAGAASAQSVPLPGLGSIDLSDGCVGVDVAVGDLAKLDPRVCVSEDGVALSGEPEVGGVQIPLEQVTDPVREATRTVTERVTEVIEGARGGNRAPSEPAPSAPGGGEAPAGGGTDTGSTDGDASGGTDVELAGTADPAPTAEDQRERERQLASIRALRSDLAGGTELDSGVAGPVEPLGGISSLQIDEPADPEVAEGSIVPGIDTTTDPDVAPSAEQAIFASGPTAPDLDEVPLTLQLLAGALVLGAGAVWTLARRELGDPPITTV